MEVADEDVEDVEDVDNWRCIVSITVVEKSDAIKLGQYPCLCNSIGKFELPVPIAKVSEDVSLDKNGMKKVLEDDQDNNHSIGLTDLLNIPSQYGLSNVILSCSSSVVEVSMVVGPFIGAGVDIWWCDKILHCLWMAVESLKSQKLCI